LRQSLWILAAMVGARSAAMAFNRLVDRRYDALNPRTADRALPRSRVTPGFVLIFTAAGAALFVFSARMLNPLAFSLSPVALAVILGYSYTKRFTSLSHLFLGLALAIAPVGGWVAVSGELQIEPFTLALAVFFWVAGFDIIYSCLDADFDARYKLFSIPARFGIAGALRISAVLHVLMVAALIASVVVSGLSVLSWAAVVVVSGILVYEHSLVKPDDLGCANVAFFTANSIISVTLLILIGLDLCLFV